MDGWLCANHEPATVASSLVKTPTAGSGSGSIGNRGERCLSDLLRQEVQVSKILGCDLELIHVRSLDVFLERQLLSASCLFA